jgi:hypothetical protein
VTRRKNDWTVFEHHDMTLKQTAKNGINTPDERAAGNGSRNFKIVDGKMVVKKRPGGIQLTCLHMNANNVILKMR